MQVTGPSLMSDINSDGVDQCVFNEMGQALKSDRAAFFMSFFREFFGANTKPHSVSEQTMEWARGVAMQASLKATLECIKSFAETDFGMTCLHSKCQRSSFMERKIRLCR